MAKVNIRNSPPHWQRDLSRPGWLRQDRVEVDLASGDEVKRELDILIESDKGLLIRLANADGDGTTHGP